MFVYHLESTLPPFNLLFYLSISEGDCMPYLMINGTTGEVFTSAILDRDDHFNQRHTGWCNVTIKVCSMFYISRSKSRRFLCTAEHNFIFLLNMNGFRELLRVYIVTYQQTLYASIQYNVDSSEKGIKVICIFLRVEIALYCIYFCLNQNKL